MGRVVALVLISFLAHSCAQVGVPTGGVDDKLLHRLFLQCLKLELQMLAEKVEGQLQLNSMSMLMSDNSAPNF